MEQKSVSCLGIRGRVIKATGQAMSFVLIFILVITGRKRPIVLHSYKSLTKIEI